MSKFVIYDNKQGGWAKNDKIEGWIFTTILMEATMFNTIEEAQRIKLLFYPKNDTSIDEVHED